MIQEAKDFGKTLIDAITPAFLAAKDIHPLDVSGKYDWRSQTYNYDVCNFGTSVSTTHRTGGNGDSSSDAYGD